MSHRKFTLLLPGYTANRFSGVEQGQVMEITANDVDVPTPHHQALTAFSVSNDEQKQPWQAQLSQILKLDTGEGTRLPGARLAMLVQQDPALPSELISSAALVCADPICLKADRDSATLISPGQLQLADDESAQLIAALNDFVAEDGLTFFSRGACEWYMSGRSAEALESYPPSFLANRNASSFLPDGDEAAPWRRLMTEIQMLLHSHPVNQLREQRGLLPVNSVWFWGGAPLPVIPDEPADVIVYADDRLARAWVEHLGIRCRPLATLLSDLHDLPVASDIVVLDLCIFDSWLQADAQRLEHELARVDEQWLQPLSALVRGGQLSQVDLLTEDGLQAVCNLQTLPDIAIGWQKWIQRFRGRIQR